MRKPLRLLASVLAAMALAACAKQEILHELDEREANEIYVLLDASGIGAAKLAGGEGGGGGNKGPKFTIAVAPSDVNHAMKILTDNQLPRKKDAGWSEVFSQGGLIPTASEEKAKTMQAITGELAKTLKSIDGVLDARVHVVLPEESVLRVKEEDKAEVTASVWYKYIPRGKNLQKPLTDQEIQDLVAHSVEKLKPERVKVIGTPALGAVTMEQSGNGDVAGGGQAMEKMMGITLLKSDVNRFRYMMIGIVLFVVVIALGFTLALLKKSGNNVRPGGGMMRPPPSEPPPG